MGEGKRSEGREEVWGVTWVFIDDRRVQCITCIDLEAIICPRFHSCSFCPISSRFNINDLLCFARGILVPLGDQ